MQHKSEQMQRTSEELSREAKRVEIKAFVCIYID